ncbi:MAG: hypothetical protein EAX90_01360 [Candidatus Heimdallarchaeota archaeon]|nr:hypothetical protein [Candidatus Heimdallarchaeota archaeon]
MTFKETFKPFLSSLFDVVMKQALEDEIITPEESVLLSQIEIDIRAFEKEVAQCIEEVGGMVDALIADCFKDKLIANVRKLALEDGVISKDEEAILVKLEDHFNITK